MKKRNKKIKKVTNSPLSKSFLLLFVVGIISIMYVFQVRAQTKPHNAPIQQNEKRSSHEKKVTLTNTEPIHIASGFNKPLSLEKPLRIIIPQNAIDVPIVHAPIFDGQWEVSEIFANHGQGSAYPGQPGNMVIFAHARENLFFNLQNVVVGNDMYILTEKKWYTYRVSEITQVNPDQVEVIAPTTDQRITLFTCSGVDDEKRFIVVGKRTEISVDTVIPKNY